MEKHNGGVTIKNAALILSVIGAFYWLFITFKNAQYISDFFFELPVILILSTMFYLVLYGIGEVIDSVCKIKDAYLFSLSEQNSKNKE